MAQLGSFAGWGRGDVEIQLVVAYYDLLASLDFGWFFLCLFGCGYKVGMA